MNLLVVGGGKFVGRAVAEEAIARGHRVTLFNRGRTTLEVPAGVEWIRGDRDGDLGALGGRSWDAVIDTCAYFPRQVDGLLRALGGRSGHYLLVSSISVYADLTRAAIDEGSPLLARIDGASETVTPETYGPFKVMCEEAARGGKVAATLIVRPGIIVGPNDPTGRFSYWVRRVAAGGEVLAPGRPDAPIQVIDARDLGGWMVERSEARTSGTFNAIGPREPLTWGGLMETATEALGSRATFTWVGDDFPAGQNADDWSQLPLYLPSGHPKFRAMFRINGDAAFASGLRLRALGETVLDTARWLAGPRSQGAKTVGLSIEREAQLLSLWKASSGRGQG